MLVCTISLKANIDDAIPSADFINVIETRYREAYKNRHSVFNRARRCNKHYIDFAYIEMR